MNTLLRTLLLEWQRRELPKIISRDTQVDIRPQEGSNSATVVTGFRRVGKTYLVYEAIEKLLSVNDRKSVIYLNFEDERIIPGTELLTDLIPEIEALFGSKPTHLFLDELQLIPNWSKWVRRTLDSTKIQLFITGSSSKMSSFELPTELRGRSTEIQVYPLNFSEFLKFKGTSVNLDNLSYVKEEHAQFEFLLDEYLVFGGLPAVVLSPQEKKQDFLQSYFQTVVQMDVKERFQVENDLALKTMLKLLLNSSYVTISKLHNNLKSMGIAVGKSTIDNYLSYIESSYFMKELHIYNQSVINQLQYPRKVYFIDTGFMSALSTKFSANKGRLLENAVFERLSQKNDTLYYYKSGQNSEVDFAILESEKVKTLYQVCWDLTDEETRKREIKSLLKAAKTLHCSDLRLITIDQDIKTKIPPEIDVISAEKIL